MSLVLLNETSQVIGQPDKLKLPLKRHQCAMLYKCLNIEKQALVNHYPFGILSSKAGSGKTATIISLILADKQINGKTSNLIIVPQNIHSQWINEINKFTDDLSVISFVNYSDISELFFNPSILLENDIVITTSLYYETIFTVIQQNAYKIKRIILDELDSSMHILKSIKEKEDYKIEAKKKSEVSLEESITRLNTNNNKIIWLISASIDNAINENGLEFQDKIISLETLNKITCKCEDSFVDKYNFVLSPPEIINNVADDISDDYFEFLSVNQLDSINSLSFQNIRSNHTNKIANNSCDAINIIAEDYSILVSKLTENIDKLKKTLKNNSMFKPSDLENLKIQIHDEEKLLSFNTVLLESIHKIKCNDNCEEKYKCINEKLKNVKEDNTKVNYLEDLLSKIDKKDKILIFSDFTDSFKTISNILKNKNIKYSELNGGTIKSIDKAISDYKTSDTSILLIDSSNEGCGMNLENSSHIIFLHKTSEILYNQIVGRAQRAGRVGQLKIITLLHKNEVI